MDHLALDDLTQFLHRITFKTKSQSIANIVPALAIEAASKPLLQKWADDLAYPGTIQKETHRQRISGRLIMEKKHNVGARIKEMREARYLSIEQLAKESKTHKKFIEELESEKLVPSIAPLLKIARGLGVQLSTLLDDAPAPGAVVSRAGRPETEIEFSGLSAYGASTLEFHSLAKNQKGRHMEPFIIDVHPSIPEDCTFSFHEGEEFIYILEGEIEVLYGDERHILCVGDSIYYDSTTPHQVKTAGDKEARILAVIYV